jgi:hypothetical protein
LARREIDLLFFRKVFAMKCSFVRLATVAAIALVSWTTSAQAQTARVSFDDVPAYKIANGMAAKEFVTAALSREITQRSDTKFTTDPSDPAELVAGKYIFARIGTKKHFWRVDLPAGEYKIIMDGHRQSPDYVDMWLHKCQVKDSVPVQGNLLLHVAPQFELSRGVVTIKSDNPIRETWEVHNPHGLNAYALAVVPVNREFSIPYFVNTPPVGALKLGETFTYQSSGKTRENFLAFEFPEADHYRVAVKFENLASQPKKTGGYLGILSPDNHYLTRAKVGTFYLGNPVIEREIKLSVPDEASCLVRIQHYSEDPQRVTISIKKWAE